MYDDDTFSIIPMSVGVNDVLGVYDAIVPRPNELFWAYCDVVILRLSPARRKCPADDALSSAGVHCLLKAAWNTVLPAFRGAGGASGGIPF